MLLLSYRPIYDIVGCRAAAHTGDTPLPYANLQLLMRQVDEGERQWSLSLGGGLCVRRVGETSYSVDVAHKALP